MPHCTKIVAIINVTPDSFSDGGAYQSVEAALARIQVCVDEGADVLDIGAESTRPDAVLLDHAQEWERLQNVLPQAVAIARRAGKKVSVDTRHAMTAAKALELDVDMVNVQSGLDKPDMLAVLRSSRCPIVMMHHLGMPADPAVTLPVGSDVVREVSGALLCMADEMQMLGIARSRLICDVGIGFGKTGAQSVMLLAQAGRLRQLLKLPLYIGHSRKSFMGLVTDKPAPARDELTLAYSSMLMQQGVEWLRVHEVGQHVALRAQLMPDAGFVI
jgi:dihydropteroate synthase